MFRLISAALRRRSTIFFLAMLAGLFVTDFGRAQTPDLRIQGTATVDEAAGSVTVPVYLDGMGGGTFPFTVTVQFTTVDNTATAPTDYTTTSGTLTFPPGTSRQYITVPIINNNVTGSNKDFYIQLSNPVNGMIIVPQCDVTIIEDAPPLPTVQFSSATYSVNETAGPATITVTLNTSSANTVTVDYATSDGTGKHPAIAGKNYTATSGTLTFDAGSTSQTFTVPIINKGKPGPDRPLNLTLSSPSGATLGTPNPAVLTIVDDNLPPPVAAIEINGPGTEDDFVFLTPSDSEVKVTANAAVKLATPQPADVPVTLSNAGIGQFSFSSDGATWSNTLGLILPQDGSPIPFTLSGTTASAKMRDAVILATAGAAVIGEKKGTVPKVELSFHYKATQTVKGLVDGKDNAAQDNYYNETVPKSYKAGPQEFKGTFGWGVLTIGKVTPSDFAGKPVVLERSAQGRLYTLVPGAENGAAWGPADTARNFPADGPYSLPTNDTEQDEKYNDFDPQSGGSKGHVYNVDAPGFDKIRYKGVQKGFVVSLRSNFAAFASFGGQRVSEKYSWCVSASWKKISSTENTWESDGSVAGDNTAKAGVGAGNTTKLSYGLGSPEITHPEALDQTTEPSGIFFIKGKNLVRGAKVELKKGKKDATIKIDALVGYDKRVTATISNFETLEIGEWTLEWTNPADTTATKQKIKIKKS